jgi:surface protein
MINSKQKIVIQNRDHLDKVIQEHIQSFGNEANLNHLDVSYVTDMSQLFWRSLFNGDISKWNVSNVKNMNSMFYTSKFNGDISNWNVSNVENMSGMFYNSKFNQNISSWQVHNVKDMDAMFKVLPFDQDISQWNTSSLLDMRHMFTYDLTLWKPISLENSLNVFSNSKIKPYWAECKTNQELVQKIKEYQDNVKLKNKLDDELIINPMTKKTKL